MTDLWKDSVHQTSLSSNRMAKIAIGHLQLLQGVDMNIRQYMITGSIFVFKSWVAYMVGVKGRALVLETVVLSLFLCHCSSALWHFPIAADCKISERQSRKNMTG